MHIFSEAYVKSLEALRPYTRAHPALENYEFLYFLPFEWHFNHVIQIIHRTIKIKVLA